LFSEEARRLGKNVNEQNFSENISNNALVLSLLSNAVIAQNIIQDSREKYQVTFDLEIVDAFTNCPLSGGLGIYAVCNDTLWQEGLEWGEWKHLGTHEFKD